MPEERKNLEPLEASGSGEGRRRRRKRNQRGAAGAASAPQHAVKPHTRSLPAGTSPPLPSLLPPPPLLPPLSKPAAASATKKDRGRLAGGRKGKKHARKDAAALAKTSGGGGGQGSELSVQARESLRWEGVLEDPQAEEERLELYRANRRQRYVAHREAALREAREEPRKTCPEGRPSSDHLKTSAASEHLKT